MRINLSLYRVVSYIKMLVVIAELLLLTSCSFSRLDQSEFARLHVYCNYFSPDYESFNLYMNGEKVANLVKGDKAILLVKSGGEMFTLGWPTHLKGVEMISQSRFEAGKDYYFVISGVYEGIKPSLSSNYIKVNQITEADWNLHRHEIEKNQCLQVQHWKFCVRNS